MKRDDITAKNDRKKKTEAPYPHIVGYMSIQFGFIDQHGPSCIELSTALWLGQTCKYLFLLN